MSQMADNAGGFHYAPRTASMNGIEEELAEHAALGLDGDTVSAAGFRPQPRPAPASCPSACTRSFQVASPGGVQALPLLAAPELGNEPAASSPV